VGDPAAGTGRRAVLAPGVEHVGVLYSATALAEARGWLDAAFGRAPSAGPVAATGGWVALLVTAVVALAWPLAALARPWRPAAPPPRLTRGRFLAVVAGPSLAVPLVLGLFDTRFLPVLVADYLALHFLAWGAAVLALLAGLGALRRPEGVWPTLAIGLAVAAFGIGAFGGALNAHAVNFVPSPGRLWVILAIAAGAVPFMLADAALTEGGRAPLWRTLVARGAALGSLGLAVALDFERLFFLLIILPLVLLFFLLFGMMGGWVGRASGRPGAVGLGLGLVLAWALGVTFPMYAP
jgi:hypothetical protein